MKPKGQLLEGGLALGSPEIEYKVLLLKNDSWSLQRLADHTNEGLQLPGPPGAPGPVEKGGGVHVGEVGHHTGGQGEPPTGPVGASLCGNISPYFRTRHMIRVTF